MEEIIEKQEVIFLKTQSLLRLCPKPWINFINYMNEIKPFMDKTSRKKDIDNELEQYSAYYNYIAGKVSFYSKEGYALFLLTYG
jgi:hypothetical protein